MAVLGSLLGTAYRDELTGLVGYRLPAEAMEVARDSVGGGLAVAEDPSAGPQQAQAVVDAVHQAFARGVAQTGLIGGDHHGRRNTDRPSAPAGPARVREEGRRAGGRDGCERGGCPGARRVHPLAQSGSRTGLPGYLRARG